MFKFKEFLVLYEKTAGVGNAGVADEARVAKFLKKQGVMRGKSAGSTNKSDLNIAPPGQKPIYGEHKAKKTAAFGQIAIHRHPETGHWYIPDKSREKNPEFARHVENAKITVTHKGKTEVGNLLQHMSKTQSHDYSKPETRKTSDDVYSDHTDSLAPLHAYMRGHGAQLKQPQHFIHISTHGTYRAGDSEHHDVHGLGYPVIHGTGRFRVRHKNVNNPNIRTVQFELRHITPSTHSIEHPNEIDRIKRVLGVAPDTQTPKQVSATKKAAGAVVKRVKIAKA